MSTQTIPLPAPIPHSPPILCPDCAPDYVAAPTATPRFGEPLGRRWPAALPGQRTRSPLTAAGLLLFLLGSTLSGWLSCQSAETPLHFRLRAYPRGEKVVPTTAPRR